MVNPIRIKSCANTHGMEAHERLRSIRKQRYPSAATAAEAMGVSPATLTHHENGTRGIPKQTIERYARFFGVTASWLLFGDESKSEWGNYVQLQLHSSATTLAPVVGWVQADVWQEPMETEPTEFVHTTVHPRFPHAPHMVLDVRGDIFDKIAPNGSQVVAIPFAETGLTAPQNGQVIITEERTQLIDSDSANQDSVKRTLWRVRDAVDGTKWLDPESTNSRYKPVKLSAHTRVFALVVKVIQTLDV